MRSDALYRVDHTINMALLGLLSILDNFIYKVVIVICSDKHQNFSKISIQYSIN